VKTAHVYATEFELMARLAGAAAPAIASGEPQHS
jgi:hypothetical protein